MDESCNTDEAPDIDTPGEVLDEWESYVARQKPGFPWILMCWGVLFSIAVAFLAAAVVVHSR